MGRQINDVSAADDGKYEIFASEKLLGGVRLRNFGLCEAT